MDNLVLVLVLALPLMAWPQSPFDGTWKFNESSAQFSQKPELFALQRGEYTCSTCTPKIAVKADGADRKTIGNKDFDTLAVKQVDDKTVQFTRKKAGKIVSESTDTVSAEGNALTVYFKEYAPNGTPMTGSVRYTRVSAGPKGAHAISGTWRTSKIENLSDQGLTWTLKSTPQGLSMTMPFYGESYDAKFDEKDYPVTGGRHTGDTVSLKKVNDNTIVETYKQDGKPLAVNEMTVKGNTMKVVSKNLRDGASMSFTATKR